LISIVDTNGSPLVQFSHFSVLEYLRSKRIQERVPHYYVHSEPAHLVVTQACLSVLLKLGDNATKEHFLNFPLARYAARHWVDHAKLESVLSQTEEEMKLIFDPESPYFAAWVWICDVDSSHGDVPLASIPETPPPPKATPLYYAARCGFHNIADWLLTTRSQDVMAHGGHFGTPFYASSAQCHHKVVEVLLKHKPAAANALGIAGWVPLHAVAMFGSLEVSRVLIEFGADVNAKHPFQLITPLLLATRNGHTDVVRLLLDHGADPEAYDEVGRSPLYRALEGGHTKITKLLRDHGAHPDTLNEDGETLLHIAPVFDDMKVVEGLLALKADVNVKDNQGQTPYQIASEWKRTEIAQLLLKHGARETSRPPSIHAQ